MEVLLLLFILGVVLAGPILEYVFLGLSFGIILVVGVAVWAFAYTHPVAFWSLVLGFGLLVLFPWDKRRKAKGNR